MTGASPSSQDRLSDASWYAPIGTRRCARLQGHRKLRTAPWGNRILTDWLPDRRGTSDGGRISGGACDGAAHRGRNRDRWPAGRHRRSEVLGEQCAVAGYDHSVPRLLGGLPMAASRRRRKSMANKGTPRMPEEYLQAVKRCTELALVQTGKLARCEHPSRRPAPYRGRIEPARRHESRHHLDQERGGCFVS